MSTIQELREEAYRVIHESEQGGNTASRIGNLYNGIIDFLGILDNRKYDDSELRAAIVRVDEALRELDSALEAAIALINSERDRLDGKIDAIDASINGRIADMLNDAEWLHDHAQGIQELVNEGEIYWKSGWNENIEAYLQEVGVWAREGDVIKTQWSEIKQDVNSITSTVAEVQTDLAGRPTSTQWSRITQKVNSIESSVNALINRGEVSEALQTSIEQSVKDGIASLNLESTYAKIDTEDAKKVLQWMYAAFKNAASSEYSFAEMVSAGKEGLNNGVSEVRTYVNAIKDGDFLKYEAGASIEAKVNDAITGLYSKATADQATTTLFSQVKKDTKDIATIVVAATGDSSSVDIATKFANWKSGLVIKSDLEGAVAGLVTQDELSNATAGLVLKSYVDTALADLTTRIGTKMAGFLLKSELGETMAQMIASDTDSGAVASIVAKVNRSGSEISLNADKINMTNAFVESITANSAFINYLKGGTAEFSGKVTAAEGEIGGFKITSNEIKSQVAENKSLTLNKDGSFTIINGSNSVKMNTNGFEVMFGGEGFRVGNFGTDSQGVEHKGMERWDSIRNVWAAMYERKIAHINKTATTVNLGNLPGVNYVLNARQDRYNRTLVVLPPVANVPDGTSIIVRGLTLDCDSTVSVADPDHESNDTILIGDYSVSETGVLAADCAEFIMCKGIDKTIYVKVTELSTRTVTIGNAWICNYYDRDV